jgi:hypothetical protein
MGNQKWYYNWSPNKDIKGTVTLPVGSVFVPMVISGSDVTTANLNLAKTYGNTLLTFNEPDKTSTPMTVAQALSYWPTLQNTNLRLGSPGVSSGSTNSSSGWLHNFMTQAATDGYRVDFVTLHFYPGYYDPSNPVASANAMIDSIKTVWNLYHKPIWLTEFALSCNGVLIATQAQQLLFMQTAIPQLESLPYVEKYNWWTLWYYNYGDWKLALVNQNGTIGTLGTNYNTYVTAPEKVLNGGFETNTLDSWSSANGTGYTGTTTTHYSGSYGAFVGGGTAKLYQTVYGLAPNTTYTLKAADLISGGGNMIISVTNTGTGGTTPTKTVTATNWEQESITLKTGSNGYSAQINFSVTATGTYGFVDNVSVQ